MPPRRTAASGPGKPSFQVGNNSTDVSDAEGEQAKPAPAAAPGPAPAGATAAPPARKTGASVPHFTSLKSEKRPRFGGDDADDEEDDEEDADPETRWLRYRSGPTTPNIAETARELRRNLSVSGLAQLANGPDGGIKRKLWRPEGEPTKEPGDWERLAVHVTRGGLRAATVSFGLRGTVMLVFAVIKFIRTRKFKGNELIQAYFGAANGRFAAMFGLWALLYKLTANSLRLLQPPPVPKRRSTLPANYGTSGSYDESGDLSTGSGAVTPHEKGNGARATEEEKAKLKSRLKRTIFMRDPRSRVWHAYVAGAVSALALLVETKDMRISLAQQLFVRGLEGSYNLAQSRGLVNIPHGSVIVFGIACGQIMYAWVNQPDTLPKGYVSWITKASQATVPSTPLWRQIGKTGTADTQTLLKYFPDSKIPEPLSVNPLRYAPVPPNSTNMRGMTGKNVRNFVELIDRIKSGEKLEYLPCFVLHPWENSHLWSPVDRFIVVTRWILPVYATLYFVPAIFLRTKSFMKAPLRIFLRSLFGSIRSSSFLGAYVIIFQILFCGYQQTYESVGKSPMLSELIPEKVRKLIIAQPLIWVAGFATSLSLFVDDSRRRAELAAYVLPKGMESMWSIARQRSWVPFVPGGDLLLTSAGMSMVMGTYAQNPEHLSGLVRRIIYQFVGRN